MKQRRNVLLSATLAAIFLHGCASYDGKGLVPGQASSSDVERVMGSPREKVALANGESTWFYPHGPAGRDTYAATIAADGRLVSIEQRLTEAHFMKLVAGASTQRDTRAIIGPPSRVAQNNLLQREVWEYPYYNTIQIPFLLYVQFSSDGVVREVLTLRDPNQDVGSYAN